MLSPVALLVCGQIVLMGSIALCYRLQPGVVRRGVPLSHYGVLRASRVAFSIGFGVGALCIATAGARLLKTMPHAESLQIILAITAVGMVGTILAPYSPKYFSLYFVHVLCAWTVFMLQVVAGLWVAMFTDNWLNWLLYGGVLLGGLLILLSFRSIKILASFAMGQLLVINASMLLIARTISGMS